ncbi:MAG: hypothetical protein VCE91_09650 [Nitrospinota bacterium]
MNAISGLIKAPRGLRLGALLSVRLAAGYATAAPAAGDSGSPGRPCEVTVRRDGRRFRAVLIKIPAAGGGIQPIFLVEPKRPSMPRRAFFCSGEAGGASAMSCGWRRVATGCPGIS